MYEELYRPLPDVNAYLERLNISKGDVCDEAYLDALVTAHQCEIPFENMDVMKKGRFLWQWRICLTRLSAGKEEGTVLS